MNILKHFEGGKRIKRKIYSDTKTHKGERKFIFLELVRLGDFSYF
jgi:hypothetical protein